MKLDGWALLTLLGVVQGLFLSALFLSSPRSQGHSNLWLGWLLGAHVLTIGEVLVCYTGFYRRIPWVVNSTEWLNFVIPPLIYCYTRSLTVPAPGLPKKAALHFLPGLLYLVFLIPYFRQSDAWLINSVRESYGQPTGPTATRPILWFNGYDAWYGWFDGVVSSYLAGYLLASGRLLWLYARKQHEAFWQLSNPLLRWLVLVLGYYGLVILLFSAFSALFPGDTGEIYVASLESVIFYGISFYVVRQGTVQLSEQAQRKKYEKSALDPLTVRDIAVRAETLLMTERLYRNPGLTVTEVAQALKVPVHHLSQALNSVFAKNFFEFVNQYRVEEMKQLLQDTTLQHYKVDEIAFLAGFNSKSVYYPSFRKATGMTPAQYRQSVLS